MIKFNNNSLSSKKRKEYRPKRLSFLPLEERIVLVGDVFTDLTTVTPSGPISAGQSVTLNIDWLDNQALSSNLNNYNETIGWGDGSSYQLDNSLVINPTNPDELLGSVSHTYATSGDYQITYLLDASNAELYNGVQNSLTVGSPLTIPIFSSSSGNAVLNDQVLATFSSANPGNPVITVQWGDGTSDNSSESNAPVSLVSLGNNQYEIIGSHTYSGGNEPNGASYNLQVEATLYDPAYSLNFVNQIDTINLVDQLADNTVAPTMIVGQQGAVNFSFSDLTTNGLSNFVLLVSVNWGDGTTDFNLTPNLQGSTYDFSDSHTYATDGTYDVTYTIQEHDHKVGVGGGKGLLAGSESFTVPISVSPADSLSLQGTPTLTNAVEGSSAIFTLDFADTNAAQLASNFQVNINWGDGTTNFANVSGSNGSYIATYHHAYSDAGSDNISYTISLVNNSQVSLSSSYQAAIADAPLTEVSGAVQLPIVENHSFSNAILGTFIDTNPLALPLGSDYTALVNWGDTSNTTLQNDPNVQVVFLKDVNFNSQILPEFEVIGAHTYAKDGTFPISLTVQDDNGGASLTFTNEGSLKTSLLWGIDQSGDLFSIGDYANVAATTTNYGQLYVDIPIGSFNIPLPIFNVDGFAVNANGTAYMVINSDSFGLAGSPLGNFSAIVSINLNNVSATQANFVTFDGFVNEGGIGTTRAIESIAFNPTNSNPYLLYALIQEGGNSTSEQLATLDLNPADIHNSQINLNLLGSLTGTVNNANINMTSDAGQALQFDGNGNLYVSDNANDMLYTVNSATGAIMNITPDNERAGLNTNNVDDTALAWNPINGTMIDFNAQNNTLGDLSLSPNGTNSVLATLSQDKILIDVQGLDFYY